jgi:hypothetical protein
VAVFARTGCGARAGKLCAPPVVCVLGAPTSGLPIARRIGARLPVLCFDTGRCRAPGGIAHGGRLRQARPLRQLAGADVYVIAIDRKQFDNAIGTVSLVLALGDIIVFATPARMRRRDGRAVDYIEATVGLRCNRDFYVARCTAQGCCLHGARGTPTMVARYLQGAPRHNHT